MGSCLAKETRSNGFPDPCDSYCPSRRPRFVESRATDVPKLLNKHINEAYKKGQVSEIEYVLTHQLFTYMLNRLEATLDPLFVIEMKNLQDTIDNIIMERCRYPPPAPTERYVDMFEDYLLDEIRSKK